MSIQRKWKILCNENYLKIIYRKKSKEKNRHELKEHNGRIKRQTQYCQTLLCILIKRVSCLCDGILRRWRIVQFGKEIQKNG